MKNCEGLGCRFVNRCILRQYFIKKNRTDNGNLRERAEPADALDRLGNVCLKKESIEKGFRRILEASRMAQKLNKTANE